MIVMKEERISGRIGKQKRGSSRIQMEKDE
jgi:hypothetical protein